MFDSTSDSAERPTDPPPLLLEPQRPCRGVVDDDDLPLLASTDEHCVQDDVEFGIRFVHGSSGLR